MFADTARNTHFLCLTMLFMLGCQARSLPKVDEKQPTRVRTVSVTEEDIPISTVQPATVYPYQEVSIFPRATGYVDEVLVDIGDAVQKGDVLVTINAPELRQQPRIATAQIEKYKALEKQAQASIQVANADVNSAEARLRQITFSLERADANLAAAEAEFNRVEDLVNLQSIERRILDEVRKKRDSALANRRAVESEIQSAQADVQVAQAQLASAESELASAKAETTIATLQLEEMNLMVEYLAIKAPFSGVITRRSVDPGDLVRKDLDGAQSPLLVLSQLDKVRIHVAVPEAQALHVNPGDSITITFPNFQEEEPVTDTVTRVSQSLEHSTRTMLVETEVKNEDGKLLPGMFGQASIKTNTKVAAKMLPARAIRFDESGGAYVYAIDQNDIVSVVSIDTGMDNGLSIEVVNGLDNHQRVIDNHLQRFTDGQKVAVLPN